MAASTTTGFPVSVSAIALPNLRAQAAAPHRPEGRPRAGDSGSRNRVSRPTSSSTRADRSSPHNGQLQAVQMLMAVNRQIYFECPVVPSLGERFLAFLHLHAA